MIYEKTGVERMEYGVSNNIMVTSFSCLVRKQKLAGTQFSSRLCRMHASKGKVFRARTEDGMKKFQSSLAHPHSKNFCSEGGLMRRVH